MTTATPSLTATPTWVRYQVLGWLCVATTIAYIDRGCIQLAVDPIRADLGLSEQEMGLVITAFFATYALFQLPTGWLGHRWGSRRALPFFSALWSAFTGVCAVAGGFWGLLLGRGGMGTAEAGIFPCAAASIARWFPMTRRAAASGVLGSFMGIGGALGAFLTGVLLTYLDWRWVFALYAMPGIVWSMWFYVWFRDRPAEHEAVNEAELDIINDLVAKPASGKEEAEPTPWGTIFSSVTMWWINGQQFFRAAAYVFFMSWFPTYLQRTRAVAADDLWLQSALPHVTMVLGSISGGFIADWVLMRTGSRRLSRQGVAGVGLVLCALLTAGSSVLDNAWLAVAAISAGAFCASLAGPAAYAVTIDLGRKHVAPVFSVMNMSGNVGAIPLPLLAPLLAAWAGWDSVLFLFAGLYLVAAGCWCFLDPDRAIIPDQCSGFKVQGSGFAEPEPPPGDNSLETGLSPRPSLKP